MQVRCVGAIARDEHGRLLLVQRGHEPARGRWSLPGGRVEPGETGVDAVVREVREETGLVVDVDRLVGTVERPGPGGVTYVIDDYAVRVRGAVAAIAADDADDARWVDPGTLGDLALTDGLLDALRDWGVV